MPPATQIKVGNTIIHNGDLYKIIKLTHITPGKGNAIVQADLRNVKTGVKTESRFRSAENVDVASVITRKMQYLYESEGEYHFMDQETFEQCEISVDVLADTLGYLVPEALYEVDLYEGVAIGISLPSRVQLKITQTDPSQKGAAGKTKPATLETGLVVQVPLFLEEGEVIVVNTESGDYVERAK